MLELNKIYNMDCLDGLKLIADKSIDLIIIDPPYNISVTGGGSFGNENREYHNTLKPISNGIENIILDELTRIMKKPNIYIWCNKKQLRQYINYFEDIGCTTDLLTWHKPNPTPTYNNKYLSDTEYLLYFRRDGIPMYGNYSTKKKYYIIPTNKEDKQKYNHPTIKPLNIIENLVINSSKEHDVVLDCYMGSGTTACACINTNRNYIGFEIDKNYYNVANNRINECNNNKWFIN